VKGKSHSLLATAVTVHDSARAASAMGRRGLGYEARTLVFEHKDVLVEVLAHASVLFGKVVRLPTHQPIENAEISVAQHVSQTTEHGEFASEWDTGAEDFRVVAQGLEFLCSIPGEDHA